MQVYGQQNIGDPSDEQLMEAVRDGDVRRLGELFDRHSRLFYGYFVRLTSDPEISNDLLQDMFLRILKYRHSYRGLSSFKTWAFRIARNLCNDHFGRNRREVNLDSIAEHNLPTSVLPINDLEKSQDIRLLHEVFATLPVDKREIITLAHFERMPYAEIGDALSISVSAVKARVHRAVKDLRRAYLKRIEKGKLP